MSLPKASSVGGQHSDGDTGILRDAGPSVMAGREFTDRDDADAPRVVIVNQRLARHAWGSENTGGTAPDSRLQRGLYPYEVVGVVRDSRYHGPRSEPTPEIFIPHSQNPYSS